MTRAWQQQLILVVVRVALLSAGVSEMKRGQIRLAIIYAL